MDQVSAAAAAPESHFETLQTAPAGEGGKYLPNRAPATDFEWKPRPRAKTETFEVGLVA